MLFFTLRKPNPGLFSRQSDNRWTPELREIWTPLLADGRPVLVTFEARLFVAVGPLVVRDPQIENIQAVESSAPIMQVKRLFNVPQVYEARRYADFSVANAAFSIAQLLGTTEVPLKAERSDEMTPEEMHSSNLILMGKPGAYDAVKQLPAGIANFVYDQHLCIRNLHPRHGELPLYCKSAAGAAPGGLTEEYALITLTPGPEKGQQILNIISGESELFLPLGMYLTDPAYARDLAGHLRRSTGDLPAAYEVLVKAELRGQRPLHVVYVAHRVLPAHF
jgi:hypothetical protein